MRARSTSLFAIGVLMLLCAACGRRGALEPPTVGATTERPAAASPRSLPQSIGLGTGLGAGAAAQDPESVRNGDELPAGATPAASSDVPLQTTRGAKRGYVVPRTPFILDPLL